MADVPFNNFSITGLSNKVHFGKGGNQLISNAGVMEIHDSGGTNLAPLLIADPQDGQHAVTYHLLNSVVGNISANLSTVQANLSTVNSNTIADVVALNNAINLVQSNVTSNVSTLLGDIAGLSNSVATLTNGINTVNSNVATDFIVLSNAVNLVQSNLAANTATLTTDLGIVSSNVAALATTISLANTAITSLQSASNATNSNVAILFSDIATIDNAISNLANALNSVSTTVTLTGDVMGTGFSGNISTTLANIGVSAGTYNSVSVVVDSKGRVTSIASVPNLMPQRYQFWATFDPSSGNFPTAYVGTSNAFANIPAGWTVTLTSVSSISVTHNLNRLPHSVSSIGYNLTSGAGSTPAWVVKYPNGNPTAAYSLQAVPATGNISNTFFLYGITTSSTDTSNNQPVIIDILI